MKKTIAKVDNSGKTRGTVSQEHLQALRECAKMPVKELTPELAEKLYTQIIQKLHDQKVSKDMVLHHLKQLKASIGRMKNSASTRYKINDLDAWFGGIYECNQLIDKLIKKIEGNNK